MVRPRHWPLGLLGRGLAQVDQKPLTLEGLEGLCGAGGWALQTALGFNLCFPPVLHPHANRGCSAAGGTGRCVCTSVHALRAPALWGLCLSMLCGVGAWLAYSVLPCAWPPLLSCSGLSVTAGG